MALNTLMNASRFFHHVMLIAFEFKQNNSVRLVRNLDSVLCVKVSSMIAIEVNKCMFFVGKLVSLGTLQGRSIYSLHGSPSPSNFKGGGRDCFELCRF